MQTNFTKKSLLLLLGFICCSLGSVKAQDTMMVEDGKNIVKWNIPAIALKNYSFQYERAVGKRMSVALGVRFAPKSNVPFSSQIEKAIDDPETWNSIKDFKTGNLAITPEFRYYMGKGVFRGFYVAPFVRYAKYNAEVPFNFEVEVEDPSTPGNFFTREEQIFLSGDVTTLTGGLMFGAQWKLSKLVYLDWWILGASYGTSSGNISGKSLNGFDDDEQEALRDALSDLDELPLVKTKYTVDKDGAKVDFDGPWANIRAGISIGFRF